MPQIVDPQEPSKESVEDLQKSFEAEDTPEDPPQEREEIVEDRIPAKYRGKSIEDIIAMHQESEKLIGRHANEVRQARELADTILKRELKGEKEAPKEDADEEIDYFVDPKKAIERAIDRHPRVRQAEETLGQLSKQQAMAKLQKEHPDMNEIVSDPDFAEFIGQSKIRQELLERADKHYDFDSADELFTSFKLRKQQLKKVVEDGAAEVKEQSEKNLKKAAVSTGTSTSAGKRIFNRAELIEWRLKYPSKYLAMQDEITRAYTEGRVK